MKAVTGHFQRQSQRLKGTSVRIKPGFSSGQLCFAEYGEQLPGRRALPEQWSPPTASSLREESCCCVWLAWQQGPEYGSALYSCGGRTIRGCILYLYTYIVSVGVDFFAPITYSDLGEKQSRLNQTLRHYPSVYFTSFLRIQSRMHSSKLFCQDLATLIATDKTLVSMCVKMKISPFLS